MDQCQVHCQSTLHPRPEAPSAAQVCFLERAEGEQASIGSSDLLCPERAWRVWHNAWSCHFEFGKWTRSSDKKRPHLSYCQLLPLGPASSSWSQPPELWRQELHKTAAADDLNKIFWKQHFGACLIMFALYFAFVSPECFDFLVLCLISCVFCAVWNTTRSVPRTCPRGWTLVWMRSLFFCFLFAFFISSPLTSELYVFVFCVLKFK